MKENTLSFAELIIGQREQGVRIEEICNASGLTQAQRQVIEKLKAEPIQHETDSADTLEYLIRSQNTLQLPRQGISRRTAMLRLAGLVVGGVAGSSLVLLACSQQPTVSPTSMPTSTPTPHSVGETLYTYRGHYSFSALNTVNAVVWSPDGRRIASGSNDATVQVWDAADGGRVFTYREHQLLANLLAQVRAVAWSPDGRRIASGSDPVTVQVWVAE